MLENQPTIGYYDISLILYKKYNINKIIYKLTQFNSYKKYIKKEYKFYYDREIRLDEIELNKIRLLKMKLEYYTKDDNDKENKNVIRIYGLENSLNLLTFFLPCVI